MSHRDDAIGIAYQFVLVLQGRQRAYVRAARVTQLKARAACEEFATCREHGCGLLLHVECRVTDLVDVDALAGQKYAHFVSLFDAEKRKAQSIEDRFGVSLCDYEP